MYSLVDEDEEQEDEEQAVNEEDFLSDDDETEVADVAEVDEVAEVAVNEQDFDVDDADNYPFYEYFISMIQNENEEEYENIIYQIFYSFDNLIPISLSDFKATLKAFNTGENDTDENLVNKRNFFTKRKMNLVKVFCIRIYVYMFHKVHSKTKQDINDRISEYREFINRNNIIINRANVNARDKQGRLHLQELAVNFASLGNQLIQGNEKEHEELLKEAIREINGVGAAQMNEFFKKLCKFYKRFQKHTKPNRKNNSSYNVYLEKFLFLPLCSPIFKPLCKRYVRKKILKKEIKLPDELCMPPPPPPPPPPFHGFHGIRGPLPQNGKKNNSKLPEEIFMPPPPPLKMQEMFMPQSPPFHGFKGIRGGAKSKRRKTSRVKKATKKSKHQKKCKKKM